MRTSAIPRRGWAAARVGFQAIGQVARIFIHYTAGSIAGGARASRAVEEKALRAWESFHMNSRGMRSIAYNVLVTQTGRRYIGRGNGGIRSTRVAGGHTECCNTSSVAVCGTLGASEEPTDEMLDGIRRTIAEMERADVAGRRANIDGHQNAPGASTACPGALQGHMRELRRPFNLNQGHHHHGHRRLHRKGKHHHHRHKRGKHPHPRARREGGHRAHHHGHRHR